MQCWAAQSIGVLSDAAPAVLVLRSHSSLAGDALRAQIATIIVGAIGGSPAIFPVPCVAGLWYSSTGNSSMGVSPKGSDALHANSLSLREEYGLLDNAPDAALFGACRCGLPAKAQLLRWAI